MNFSKPTQLSCLLSLLLILWRGTLSADSDRPFELPTLGGGSTTSVVSLEEEYELGQTYLKVILGQTPTVSDPESKQYLEEFVHKMAEFSELSDHRLSIIIANDRQLNAFAVPGGIVIINVGLFLNADNEAQFASVVAHELAHLSQRHYARTVEEANNNRLPAAAALLGSILLMVTAGGDAGIAALSATAAGLQSQRLRFSRQYEREADNIGLQTLAKAGFDPDAMPGMFDNMYQVSRLHSTPPEFLLTHPVTENRISDARARAAQISGKKYQGSLEYQLIRMRLNVLSSTDLDRLIQSLKAETERDEKDDPVQWYGLAMANLQASQYNKASAALKKALKSTPNDPHLLMTQSRIDSIKGDVDSAVKRLDKLLSSSPENYPLLATKAHILTQHKRYTQARDIQLQLSRQRPNDPDVWYQLAEIQGLTNDILGVHLARAEYFYLTGNLNGAINHLQYAKKMAKDKKVLTAKIETRLSEFKRVHKELQENR